MSLRIREGRNTNNILKSFHQRLHRKRGTVSPYDTKGQIETEVEVSHIFASHKYSKSQVKSHVTTFKAQASPKSLWEKIEAGESRPKLKQVQSFHYLIEGSRLRRRFVLERSNICWNHVELHTHRDKDRVNRVSRVTSNKWGLLPFHGTSAPSKQTKPAKCQANEADALWQRTRSQATVT